MSRSILYELYNNSLPNGTGIATYSRNLTEISRQLGYHVQGLYHTTRAVSSKDSVLSEVAYFDANKVNTAQTIAYLAPRWIYGAPMGIEVRRLSQTGVVIGGLSIGEVDQRFLARYFYDTARLHFKRYGVRATLNFPSRADLFHATQATPLRLPRAVNVYTIHDLVPLRLPYATLDDKRYFYDVTKHLCKAADHIVTVSEASRRDLIEIVGADPERVTNTYQAVSFPQSILNTGTDEAANFLSAALNLDYKGYFLFYGAIEPKKNIGRIIDSYLGSGSRRPLVIAGGVGWSAKEDLDRITELESNDYRIQGDRISRERRVIRLGRLPLHSLAMLVRGARALLFPSLYEGFGLPVLESMLLKTPVLTSNSSSLVEVAGNAASLVDPFDVARMTKSIIELDADDDLCAELAERGIVQAEKFSPEAYKARIAKLYGDLLGT